MQELLTTEELADFLGLSRHHLVKMRADGSGPAFVKFQPGAKGTVRYRGVDVEAWLKERVQKRIGEGAEG